MKMQNPITIWKIVIIGIGLFITYQFINSRIEKRDILTRSEFRQYEKAFNAEIDTLNFKLDRTDAKVDTVLLDLDSLKNNTQNLLQDHQLIYYSLDSIKKGQIIIYREIRKTDINDKTFFEKLRLILK